MSQFISAPIARCDGMLQIMVGHSSDSMYMGQSHVSEPGDLGLWPMTSIFLVDPGIYHVSLRAKLHEPERAQCILHWSTETENKLASDTQTLWTGNDSLLFAAVGKQSPNIDCCAPEFWPRPTFDLKADRWTDECYQVHYLPAAQCFVVDKNTWWNLIRQC